MRNADRTLVEADVFINGEELNFAQSMTLRVAISSFLMCCQVEELGAIGPLYAERCREILKLIEENIKAPPVPRLREGEMGTEAEIDRLESALRWIWQNCTSIESVHDNISRALRGKSVP